MGATDTRLVTRVGVIGDVHTEVDSVERVIAHLQAEGIDTLLCTGDLVDGPLGGDAVDRCVTRLQAAGALTIIGNHDRWLQDGEMRDLSDATDAHDVGAAAMRFLAELPQVIDFETPRGPLLFCHGIGTDDMAGVKPHQHGPELARNEALQALIADGKYRFVISGHTHRRMVRDVQGLTLINAGTLLRDHEPGCLLVDFDAGRVDCYRCTDGGPIVAAEQHELTD